MAAIDTGHFVPAKGFRVTLASQIAGFWNAMRERREERRVLAQLSRYEPRLLCDMGVDPNVVQNATSTAWDVEVR